MKKKGQIGDLQKLATPLVAIALVLVIGFLILAEIKANDNVTANSHAENGTNEVIEALASIPGWLSIIIVTAIGAILLGLITYFRNRS